LGNFQAIVMQKLSANPPAPNAWLLVIDTFQVTFALPKQNALRYQDKQIQFLGAIRFRA